MYFGRVVPIKLFLKAKRTVVKHFDVSCTLRTYLFFDVFVGGNNRFLRQSTLFIWYLCSVMICI